MTPALSSELNTKVLQGLLDALIPNKDIEDACSIAIQRAR
ncbi:hypothetical protein VCHA43P277_160094 [Vibrio chagasii]|nr:hypothetical protein VCHA34P126_140082 [Vibrio chagasii]CAH6986329.1 hypothetical protein VCHA43P277_160094 [Vibrio chagasii]CAH7034250.1 hypothetical protein VCHA41O247_160095 [Vibrio chagasii]CAH7242825.1 hypothetical protein VCHA50P420_160048 [Vibrio chagasii]